MCGHTPILGENVRVIPFSVCCLLVHLMVFKILSLTTPAILTAVKVQALVKMVNK